MLIRKNRRNSETNQCQYY